jgi:uncharacterized repeat protein (TIGR03803 family)
MKRLGFSSICIAAAFCITATAALPAQTFNSLVSFDITNGAYPWFVSLVQGTDGNLYGTTTAGGENTGCGDGYGCGTIFRITPAGELTTLYSFCSQASCADGWAPMGSLVQGTNGNFYGTTPHSSYAIHNACELQCGTIFEITPSGKFTNLYAFCSQPNCADGYYVGSALSQGADGNFYGTTFHGGSSDWGTVFNITPAGTLTTIYNFCSQAGCMDGAGPRVPPVQATNGYLYGSTTLGGGTGNCDCGTIYAITAAGKLTTLLSFSPDRPGGPSELIQASDGNLYGTSPAGVGNSCKFGCEGSVFQLTPKGKLTYIYTFCDAGGYCPDGNMPSAGVTQGSDGNFYGTTSEGGNSSDSGTAFKLTPAGQLTTLYTFCSQTGCPDGHQPSGGLEQATDGTFYGVTYYGGDNKDCGGLPCGTLFSISVGLGPFVEATPDFGKVASVVGILGSGLTGTTSVTFNGVPATTFTAESDTFIKAEVPSGATSGTIQVTTPSGTLSSNVAFQVLH